MQTYELLVKERSVRPNSNDMTLVRTSIGIDRVHILFDNDEWLDFPISCTFAQGEDIITIPLTVRPLSGSEWVAEATVTVPYEVIDMTGAIRVTLQGTDSQGRHIITAKGSPLSVEEAGDVIEGVAPSEYPTTDQWQQIYSDAQAAVNDALSALGSIDGRISDAIASALEQYGDDGYVLPVATDEILGGVKIGSGIGRGSDGTIFVAESGGSDNTKLNARLLNRIAAIVDATISATYDGSDISETTVSSDSIPIATLDKIGGIIPDGTSVTIDDDGMIHAEAAYIPMATLETPGQVIPDGVSIVFDDDGRLHGIPPIATIESIGGVMPDGTTIVVDDDGIIRVSGLTDEEIVELTPLDDPIPDGDTMLW